MSGIRFRPDPPAAAEAPPEAPPGPSGIAFDEYYAKLDKELAAELGGAPPEAPPAPPAADAEDLDPAKILAEAQRIAAEAKATAGKAVDEAKAIRLEAKLEKARDDFLADPTRTSGEKLLASLIDTQHGVEAFKASIKLVGQTATQIDADREVAARTAAAEVEAKMSDRVGGPIQSINAVKLAKVNEQDTKDLAEGRGLDYLDRKLDGFSGHISHQT